ncbi:DNA polymerase III catalytic subunit, PolC type [Desulforamulus reducens MI-1]|uniref:DNA polymerase III PolC-type n=1 Tax=Desulforamulus reducens (strain ATCC BAA-1160 / DSM 100696 / MI-1) TaxID=349161 RepID=A4J5Y0_DESRM|nr:PolC-type DNA polymerase III [Desulforamulus reducens]ABO50483.1 DNA polymerase III catalytic subunit, PolC type [Desulforamulus reducens MI-1]
MAVSLIDVLDDQKIGKNLLEVAKHTQVVSVAVNIRKRQWRLRLNLHRQISNEEINSLKSALATITPGPVLLEVDFQFVSTQSMGEEINFEYLKEELIKKFPVARCWLQNTQWECKGKKLEITLPDEVSLELLRGKKCDLFLEGCIKNIYGLQYKVLFLMKQNADTNDEWCQTQDEMEKILWQKLTAEKVSVQKEKKNGSATGNLDDGIIIGKPIKGEPKPIHEITEEERNIIVEGKVFDVEIKQLKSGRQILTFNITDNTDSIEVKKFLEEDDTETSERLKNGSWVIVRGPVQYDKFSQELTVMAYDINLGTAKVTNRDDKAADKRVELHLHTKMSSMDSVMSAVDAVKQAAAWGHPAVAITDHGVVQAFPEAYAAAKKAGIKLIYGVEGYLIDDGIATVVSMKHNVPLQGTEHVIIDFETTGFSPQTDEIIEIGAVKYLNGEEVGRFGTLVNPKKEIPFEVTKLTGITDEMVKDAPDGKEALTALSEFMGEAVLVAHNASFDLSFLRVGLRKYLKQEVTNPAIDTLGVARVLFPNLKNHKLNTLVKEFKIELTNHHRAVDDASATAKLWQIFLRKLAEQEISDVKTLSGMGQGVNQEKLKSRHVTILVKDEVGLKNLYQLITLSHLRYFHRQPRIPRRELVKYREGLLIGSACEAGEFYQALMAGASQEELEDIASFYDYLEIQPLGNNEFMIRTGQVNGEEDLKEINRKIVALGSKLGIPVVATGDVHFLNPEDEVYRRILMAGKGFDDADNQAPLYFKTTEEMLKEFSYLGRETAFQVVVSNPRNIASMIQAFKPIPDTLHPPYIEGAEQQITDMTLQRARELYGEPLPEVVQQRVDKELKSIIGNGFAVLYLIAHKLVKKSLDDGYLVGSRGSVGSSLVATFTNITEVNPLPPHYRCPNCLNSEFLMDGSAGCGADMPDKNCPKCGTNYIKDGHDIPFEVFLGFDGDKVPDIDLNFSGDYQPRAHKYTEELFGKDYVYRAGTIGTIAEKTAFGFVKNYFEERNIKKRSAEMKRLVLGCAGVKRTTGQHPGGLMVVPNSLDVHMFTPVQRPADDVKSDTRTTHFDYHSIHDSLVKLDILGHDDPTVIRMLEDLTSVNAREIPLDDPKTMSLFASTDALGVTPEDIRSQVGTYAIPEFGTKFVRQMLVDTKPTTFSELVRISGFSHGTDVWLNNAQDLIKEGTCKLSEAISARDDIMVYLIYQGLPPKQAFKIMEGVRKGKGVKEEDAEAMRSQGVPEWYIESCRKIKYMFPKAHATAYVMMAFRIAWFKVYRPEAFYAAYFTVRADDFDAELMVSGPNKIKQVIEEIEEKGNAASQKEKNMLTILEVALEANCRGIKILPVNLEKSDATKFLITPEGLLSPFGGLQGVGASAAKNIVAAREQAPFTSIDDLRNRAKISKTVIEVLQNHGCLNNLQESDQMSLF